MKYYTVKPNIDFWHEYITLRSRFRKYNLTELARELGYSCAYLCEILKGNNKGEISARFIGTTIGVMGCSFEELWQIEPVKKEPNDSQPQKTNGQVFSANGGTNGNGHNGNGKHEQNDELLVDQEERYRYLMASADFANRIGYFKKSKEIKRKL